MQYLLLIYTDEAKIAAMGEARLGAFATAYAAYTEALKKAGVYLASARLRPVATASSVRLAGGKPQVLNGPYAETREQLGGYYAVDVPDDATAQSWAARCPGAEVGTMEVRAVWPM